MDNNLFWGPRVSRAQCAGRRLNYPIASINCD